MRGARSLVFLLLACSFYSLDSASSRARLSRPLEFFKRLSVRCHIAFHQTLPTVSPPCACTLPPPPARAHIYTRLPTLDHTLALPRNEFTPFGILCVNRYLDNAGRPDGVTGTPYALSALDERTKLHTAYVLTFKAATRVTCPTTLNKACNRAFEMRAKLQHYDEYLYRAKADDTADKDRKTGEVLGRFPARCAFPLPAPLHLPSFIIIFLLLLLLLLLPLPLLINLVPFLVLSPQRLLPLVEHPDVSVQFGRMLSPLANRAHTSLPCKYMFRKRQNHTHISCRTLRVTFGNPQCCAAANKLVCCGLLQHSAWQVSRQCTH